MYGISLVVSHTVEKVLMIRAYSLVIPAKLSGGSPSHPMREYPVGWKIMSRYYLVIRSKSLMWLPPVCQLHESVGCFFSNLINAVPSLKLDLFVFFASTIIECLLDPCIPSNVLQPNSPPGNLPVVRRTASNMPCS